MDTPETCIWRRWTNPCRGSDNRVLRELPTHLRTLTSTTTTTYLSPSLFVLSVSSFLSPSLSHQPCPAAASHNHKEYNGWKPLAAFHCHFFVTPINFHGTDLVPQEGTTQQLPMDEHKSSNPSPLPFFLQPSLGWFASCY